MKLMKWNEDKLKIYLTLDELLEKGITAEDLKVDCEKVHDIVQEIVNEACREFGFMLAGSIAVEIYSMQQEQGLIMIVSKDEDYPFCEDDEDVFYSEGCMPDEAKCSAVYTFADIEDVVQMCRVIGKMASEAKSSLYHIDGLYCMHFKNVVIEAYNHYIPIIQEYGSLSSHSPVFIENYGKLILKGNAIEAMNEIF